MILQWTRMGRRRWIANDGPFLATIEKTPSATYTLYIAKIQGEIPKSGSRQLHRRRDIATKDEAMRIARELLQQEPRT